MFAHLPGRVPSLGADYQGCAFAGRCPEEAVRQFPSVCRKERPELRRIGDEHVVACHFVAEQR